MTGDSPLSNTIFCFDMNKYERYRLHECSRICDKMLVDKAYDDSQLCEIKQTITDIKKAEEERQYEYTTPKVRKRYMESSLKLIRALAYIPKGDKISLYDIDCLKCAIEDALEFDKEFGAYSTWYTGMRSNSCYPNTNKRINKDYLRVLDIINHPFGKLDLLHESISQANVKSIMDTIALVALEKEGTFICTGLNNGYKKIGFLTEYGLVLYNIESIRVSILDNIKKYTYILNIKYSNIEKLEKIKQVVSVIDCDLECSGIERGKDKFNGTKSFDITMFHNKMAPEELLIGLVVRVKSS